MTYIMEKNSTAEQKLAEIHSFKLIVKSFKQIDGLYDQNIFAQSIETLRKQGKDGVSGFIPIFTCTLMKMYASSVLTKSVKLQLITKKCSSML